ncbi:P-loop containing protein [Fusarium sp. NRRL 25303]|nr:P-loop containing protein [Fusarium sp. NRRL 25303]
MAENSPDNLPGSTEAMSSQPSVLIPRYIVIHRVECPGSTPAHSGHPATLSYQDVPRLFVGDNKFMPLRGRIPDENSQMRAKKDHTISFIIYRIYNCLEYHETVFGALKEASANSSTPDPSSQFFLLPTDADDAVAEGESMEVVSTHLKNAIEAVKVAGTKKSPVDESLLLGWGRESSMVAPYLHFYHTRNLLRDYIPYLPERQSKELILLLGYLDKEYSTDYQEAENLFLGDGLVNRKHFHKLFGPREIIVTVEEGHHVAMVSKYPPLPGSNPIRLECEMWKFNGRFAKVKRIVTIPWPKHAAEVDKVSIKSLGIFPLRFDHQVEHRLRKRGDLFWQLRKPRLILYNAPSQVLEYRMRNGRYIVDMETYCRFHRINTLDDVVTEHVGEYLPLETPSQPHLLPAALPFFYHQQHVASDYTTRSGVGKLAIEYAVDIVWNEDMFDMLVTIPEGEKNISRALLHGNKASIDVIAGRDKSRLILIYGDPGSGKTFAAKALAEIASRPLYRLTPYEVGIELNQVENNIKEAFYLGDMWGAAKNHRLHKTAFRHRAQSLFRTDHSPSFSHRS